MMSLPRALTLNSDSKSRQELVNSCCDVHSNYNSSDVDYNLGKLVDNCWHDLERGKQQLLTFNVYSSEANGTSL
jgi:hypothetical protein